MYMIGRVYINEINSQAVALDVSAGIAAILRPNTPYGFAYLTAIRQLLDYQLCDEQTLLVRGSTPDLKLRSPRLPAHAGLIARYGARLAGDPVSSERSIATALDGVVETIGSLPRAARFREAVTAITLPFARAANGPDRPLHMVPGEPAPWLSEPDLQRRTLQIQEFITAPVVA